MYVFNVLTNRLIELGWNSLPECEKKLTQKKAKQVNWIHRDWATCWLNRKKNEINTYCSNKIIKYAPKVEQIDEIEFK